MSGSLTASSATLNRGRIACGSARIHAKINLAWCARLHRESARRMAPAIVRRRNKYALLQPLNIISFTASIPIRLSRFLSRNGRREKARQIGWYTEVRRFNRHYGKERDGWPAIRYDCPDVLWEFSKREIHSRARCSVHARVDGKSTNKAAQRLHQGGQSREWYNYVWMTRQSEVIKSKRADFMDDLYAWRL